MGVMGVYADALMREAWVLTAVAIQNDRIQLATSGLGPELISYRGAFVHLRRENSKIAAS